VTRLRIGLAVLLSPWAAPALVILMAVVTSYTAVVLLGLPLFTWLKRHRRLDWPTLVACGAAAGVICFFVFEVLLEIGAAMSAEVGSANRAGDMPRSSHRRRRVADVSHRYVISRNCWPE
jgi:homospermidine synthase